jgi:hypothetical protein
MFHVCTLCYGMIWNMPLRTHKTFYRKLGHGAKAFISLAYKTLVLDSYGNWVHG